MPSLTVADESPTDTTSATSSAPSETTSTAATTSGTSGNAASPSTVPEGDENSVQLYLSMGEFKNFEEGARVPRDSGTVGYLQPSYSLFLDGEVPKQSYCSFKYTVTAPDQTHLFGGETKGLADCRGQFGVSSYADFFKLKEPGEYTVEISVTYMDGEWFTASKSFTLI